MNAKNQSNREQDLKQRKEALRKWELELRLREEAQMNAGSDIAAPTPTYNPAQPQESSGKDWLNQLTLAGKFFGIVVAVIVAVKIAGWVAMILLIGTTTWAVAQLFKISQRRS